MIVVRNKEGILHLVGRITFLGTLYWFLVMTGCEKQRLTSTERDITAVSDGRVRDLGYDLGKMKVQYDFGNRTWKEYVKSESSPDVEKMDSVLRQRDFQAVYYCPKGKVVLGGDIWVFVDKNTKEIITVLRGK